ncbi:MAG: hypothetical protein ACRCWQ_07110 [Bacilli bacterium]
MLKYDSIIGSEESFPEKLRQIFGEKIRSSQRIYLAVLAYLKPHSIDFQTFITESIKEIMDLFTLFMGFVEKELSVSQIQMYVSLLTQLFVKGPNNN